MISIIAEIGTLNSKIGFGSESTPRMSTESLLLQAQSHRNYHEEDDELFAHTPMRNFAYTLDTTRNDIKIQDIFDKQWKNEKSKLELAACKIKPEEYCKFLGDLIGEMREGHQGECGILLVEPSYLPTNDIANIRDTVCQHLLDELNIQSVYFLKGSVSTNLAQGTTSGIVVDSGHHFTTVARVHDGYQDSISTFSFGANVVDAQIQKYIQKKGYADSLSYRRGGSNQFQQLLRSREFRDIKAQLFRENPDIQSEREVQVQLPDKQVIKIDKEELSDPFTTYAQYKKDHYLCLPSQYRGLSHCAADLMQDSKEKFKQSLGKYITLTGGNFLFRDLPNRIENQLRKSAGVRQLGDVQFVNNKNSLLSSWIGGSIVSSLAAFTPYWVTNKEWKQNGVSVVMKKCP